MHVFRGLYHSLLQNTKEITTECNIREKLTAPLGRRLAIIYITREASLSHRGSQQKVKVREQGPVSEPPDGDTVLSGVSLTDKMLVSNWVYSIGAGNTQLTRGINPMLLLCWADVEDGGLT